MSKECSGIPSQSASEKEAATPLLEKLSGLIGYGPKGSKVIFLGIEEKTDDSNPESYRRRLELQSQFEVFMDLREVCTRFKEKGLFDPQQARPQQTWSPLCSVMLGLCGKFNEMCNQREVIQYQLTSLGRIPGDCLLAELLPVPKFGSSIWGETHKQFLGFSEIDAYHSYVLPPRQKLLASFLVERFAEKDPRVRPRLVIAYGKTFWLQFQNIFKTIAPMKYSNDLAGRIKWAEHDGCLFVLAYHPVSREQNGNSMKFDCFVARRIVEIYRSRFGTCL